MPSALIPRISLRSMRATLVSFIRYNRKSKRKRRIFPFHRFAGDITTKGLHETSNEWQSNTGTGVPCRKISFKNTEKIFFRDSKAGVFDIDEVFIFLLFKPNLDVAFLCFMNKKYCIFKEIIHDVHHESRITPKLKIIFIIKMHERFILFILIIKSGERSQNDFDHG